MDKNLLFVMSELIQALRENWDGHEKLRAMAINRAPKYGQNDDDADKLAKQVMNLWCQDAWKHQTRLTQRRFRPGMLS